jgi:hypothetical protein
VEEAGGRDGLGADPRRHSARCAASPVEIPIACRFRGVFFFCEFGSIDDLVNVCCCVSQGRRSITSSLPGRTRSAAKVPPWTSPPLRFLCGFLQFVGVAMC